LQKQTGHRTKPKRDQWNLIVVRLLLLLWQIEQEMKAQKLTKTALAAKMHTSRAALNRLLDASDTSLTLTTLASAATALGKHIRVELAA
jgi:DNA-binding Xre family transcriptional regulator